jgi:cobalt-zinc-cadmium efflux system membrane fusion protein
VNPFVLIFVLLILAGCARTPEHVDASLKSRAAEAVSSSAGRVRFDAGSPQLKRLRIAEVALSEVAIAEVVAPGRVIINPNRISRVGLPVPGRVMAVEVRLGDAVTQGQPLLRVESPEAEDAVSRTYQAEAAQSQARGSLAKAQADLDRFRDLFQHGATARKEVLNAEAELTRAQAVLKDSAAGLEQARRRLSILGLNGGGFGQYVVVRSPIAGKVLDLQVVRGEFRNDTSAPLITVADLSSVWVTSAIPENSIRWIERGEHVRIELAAYPGEVFTGRVMRVADTVDPQTRAVEVQTELSNRDGRLRPEMFARIRHSHGSRMLPVVPSSAVVQSGGSAWVYVARSDHEFEKVKVTVGEDAGANVPVLSGVNRGDRVVVDGAILLQGQFGGGR